MFYIKYFMLLLVSTWPTDAVKVNMKGKMNLGKDVVDVISRYLNSQRMSFRRYAPDEVRMRETISSIVEREGLCKGRTELCINKLKKFIIEYVSMMANGIENIFFALFSSDSKETKENEPYCKDLLVNNILPDIKNNIIKPADFKIIEDNKHYVWIDTLKKISAKFQEGANDFLEERLEGSSKEIKEVKKKLAHKVITAVSIVESKYINKLCFEHKICIREHIVTQSFSDFLDAFSVLSNAKAREFMKSLYDALPDDIFYYLTADTLHEFQVVLSDMGLSPNVPTKDILESVGKAVQGRIDFLKDEKVLPKPYDALMINVILCDLDHFYYPNKKVYHFENFLSFFRKWAKGDSLKFRSYVKQLLDDITIKLNEQSQELITKLANEVRVFLELTLDV